MTEQERLEDLLTTFSTSGWRHLMDEFREVAEGLDSITGVPDEKTLFLKQGRLETLRMILAYEDTVRRAFEDEEAA